MKSLINSLKKEPKLLKWFPTSPRPLWRPQPQPLTPPVERSPSDQRMPSSPCELVCGLAHQMAGPSCLQPLAPPPVPSPHEALWPCTAVSMEMPLYLLPGLPLVRTALATFSPGVGGGTVSLWLGGPLPSTGSLCSRPLPGELGSRAQPQARLPAHREGGQTLASSSICPCPFPGPVGLRLACPPCPSVSERACLHLQAPSPSWAAASGNVSPGGTWHALHFRKLCGVPLHGGSPLEPLFGTQQLSLGQWPSGPAHCWCRGWAGLPMSERYRKPNCPHYMLPPSTAICGGLPGRPCSVGL